MPVILAFAIVAVGIALILAATKGSAGRGKRFVATAAVVWVALIVIALIVLTVATLIFGR